jgi:hypothetical protein
LSELARNDDKSFALSTYISVKAALQLKAKVVLIHSSWTLHKQSKSFAKGAASITPPITSGSLNQRVKLYKTLQKLKEATQKKQKSSQYG